MKLDDMDKVHSRMRGYIPEYDKLPKIPNNLSQRNAGSNNVSKTTSPRQLNSKRALEELQTAAEGLPKIPEFL
jgi:hypothetical protein